MDKFILVMQCKQCSKVFSSVNKALEHVCPEELGTQPTAHNSQSDAIAALRDLVAAIDKYNSNPEFVHSAMVRDCDELRRAKDVLLQHT
jgi:predicted  nucleic acid-binding Zn-ribbon protein